MSYITTVHNANVAERWHDTSRSSAEKQAAADALPLNEWSEARRDMLTPQVVALNHMLHVNDCAAALRAALADMPANDVRSPEAAVERAALALLRAIGEGGDNA